MSLTFSGDITPLWVWGWRLLFIIPTSGQAALRQGYCVILAWEAVITLLTRLVRYTVHWCVQLFSSSFSSCLFFFFLNCKVQLILSLKISLGLHVFLCLQSARQSCFSSFLITNHDHTHICLWFIWPKQFSLTAVDVTAMPGTSGEGTPSFKNTKSWSKEGVGERWEGEFQKFWLSPCVSALSGVSPSAFVLYASTYDVHTPLRDGLHVLWCWDKLDQILILWMSQPRFPHL